MAVSISDLGALHATITFTILAFIPMLLLKYQKKDTSPFDDCGFILLAFYLATLLYAIAMVTDILLRIRDAECPKIVGNICLLCGPLATISLVFIPFPLVGWSLFALWTIWFVKLALDTYREISQLSQLLKEATQRASNYLWDKLLGRRDHGHSSSISSSSDSHVIDVT
ncbi:hypothetical protein COLO4_09669 [Corchorus olitorius]|uniref:Uncharacterized protein n=1 Tax=Corchorus olitorius TaxID=93759 RepID=A0A1R3KBB9_9ROSI|nr:hypothetical protein COLO4_09669 [Corchorus olitorius]